MSLVFPGYLAKKDHLEILAQTDLPDLKEKKENMEILELLEKKENE